VIATTAHELISVASHLPTAGVPNPLDGVVPDFTIFGAEFNAWWKKLLGGLWALSILVSVAFLMLGLTQMGKATTQQNAQEHAIGRTKATMAGITLACLAGLAVIVGAILSVAS
jgi:hypothetical protein